MKRILFCIIAVVAGFYTFAASDDDPFKTGVIKNMLTRVKINPQEKIYLHTDRDHYEAGEQVWLRAYLADAVTNRPSANSRYVYVELTDNRNQLYSRIKLWGRDSVFAGHISLSKDLPQGEYFLRAYSYWMLNLGEDLIFKKKIRVVNPQDSKVKTSLKIQKDPKNGKDYLACIRFFNGAKEPYRNALVKYDLNGNSRSVRTDKSGEIRMKLDSVNRNSDIRVKFVDGDPVIFERRLSVPAPEQKLDLQFFPEGGHLLTGCQQMVAFKAVGSDGLSREVEGSVCNERGEFVAALRSLHKGMGMFMLPVEHGVRYYADVVSSDSARLRIPLPEPSSSAVGVTVRTNDSLMVWSVICGDSARVSGKLYLMFHRSGVPLLCREVPVPAVGRIPMKQLPEGILHLVLFDEKGVVHSDRLVFVRRNHPELVLEETASGLNVRERYPFTFNLPGKPQKGWFSVAVTDNTQTEQDSLSGNILSGLLLTSDLKGYVEDPGYYFRNTDRMTDRYLDLLMCTQGWTRFDVGKYIRGQYDTACFYLERGQAISGKVKNFWGNDAGGAGLVLLGTNRLIRMTEADKSGRFMVDGISFADSTQFVVQAKSSKGRRTVEVIVDRDSFPESSFRIPYNADLLEREENFFEKYKKDFYYENGMKIYILDEAVVTRKKPKTYYSLYDQMADDNIDSTRLASMADQGLKAILESLPAVFMDEPRQMITYHEKPLYLVVNDREEDYNYVSMIDTRALLSVGFLSERQSLLMFGGSAPNGALILTLKIGYVPTIDRLNLATFSLLGYQKPAEFYEPRYGVDSVRRSLLNVPDRRVTIYWNPDVKMQNGKASFSVNTSDSYGPYTMVIEGILEDGTPYRKEEKISLQTPR